jgi:hypothetical protein
MFQNFYKYKMQMIQSYLYPNIVEVQFLDPSIFTTRNRVVYSRPIKIYQGIDNPLQIVVKNQDQKAINVTGYAVQVDIQDPLTQTSVESLAVTLTNAAKGLGTVTVPRDTVNALEQRFYKIVVKIIHLSDNVERPLYTDSNYGAALDLEVLPGWYESMALPTFDNDEVIDAGTI